MIAEFPTWTQSFAVDLGIVAGVLLSLAVIWRKAVKPAVCAIRKAVAWGKRLEETMETVQAQLLTNGGYSLRDEVRRSERRLARIEDHLGLDSMPIPDQEDAA